MRLWCCTADGWPHAVAAGGFRLVCLGFPACLGWGCLPLGASPPTLPGVVIICSCFRLCIPHSGSPQAPPHQFIAQAA